MSQTFDLCVATDTITNDAQQLGVTVDELKRIGIHVSVKIVRHPILQLQLSYQVALPTQSLATQFNWPTWQSAHVGFVDYLWEETCLECFITGRLVNDDDTVSADNTESYIEMNASPDGRYALYQFERYRHPNTLPPMPLYQPDGHTRISVNWTDNIKPPVMSVKSPLSNTASLAHKSYHYERSVGLPLTQLPNQQYAIGHTTIKHLHPCVILWFGETALYFASSHATPPDFHNRNYWSKFEG
ncbi:DOMON domain-containing protein [Psychrobacter vallis]|uniref:hypothetical protein n=1 Tax=Psychrobacter vallis TaxID=248451 RepID=UPI00191823CA|nr:hypothetical protein [Psychrobacter vallis]